ncbi:MAG: transcriptional regulator, partial [Anaerolineaceae bacterium]|nr:transcriptional regulator [Anaerolineaceae bacterium]
MQELARFYKALGDETRLRLMVLLAQQEPGRAMCVGRLAHELGVTASAVSQHLRVLKDL